MKSLLLMVVVLTLCGLALPQEAGSQPAAITNGPVVEGTTATTAVIAWTTTVNAGTMVRYGFDQAQLTYTAEMPWGGITHRVHLKNLKPATLYYFQAVSPKAQGSGQTIESPIGSFTTQAVLTPESH